MRIRPQRRSGFTLVEIIIVVMLIGMIMAWGVPTFVQTFKRQPMQQAVNDLLEICASARASAIMTGVPAEMIVTGDAAANRITFSVQRGGAATDPLSGAPTASGEVSSTVLPESIELELMFVNLQDALLPDSPPARVKFYPDGTCQEFAVVLLERSTNKRRLIRLDVITGHADLKPEDQIAKMKK
ncbi:MAG: hypothetical protein K0Q55_2901 [Verrucomicrobia bacterium]|jgi:prepilin-type N-terminal cleavage/methylation domain-containing protein|nr:hypothetical protein [Verrucomicrobiota bacterium]